MRPGRGAAARPSRWGGQIKLGNFVQIGRMALSLVFGVVGGSIGRGLGGRRATPRAGDGG